MSPRPDDAALAGAAAVMAALIDRYHTTAPERLAALVADAGAEAGADGCTLHLQDYAQELLVPLTRDGGQGAPVPIDGTLAGRAFTEEQELEVEEGERVRL